MHRPVGFRIIGIDHVQLAAPYACEEQARRFFGEVLGMSEIAKPPELATHGGCWFECGDRQLHVGVERDFAPAREAHPAFRVHDLSALKVVLRSKTVDYMDDTSNPEVHRIFVRDPWGNRLEFVEVV
jgi:catechol 2,3-dioxygenase-like lactoylglutathione lyase family enzyme